MEDPRFFIHLPQHDGLLINVRYLKTAALKKFPSGEWGLELIVEEGGDDIERCLVGDEAKRVHDELKKFAI